VKEELEEIKGGNVRRREREKESERSEKRWRNKRVEAAMS